MPAHEAGGSAERSTTSALDTIGFAGAGTLEIANGGDGAAVHDRK